MQHTLVHSSNVYSIAYDNTAQLLEVCYRSGGTYQYFNVPPEHYQSLMTAVSKGTYLADHIKPYYRYRKVR